MIETHRHNGVDAPRIRANEIEGSLGGRPIRVYRNGTQSITAGAAVDVQFNVASFDPNGEFNTSTYKFSPVLEGYYLVTVGLSVTITSDQKKVLLHIYKNDAGTSETVNEHISSKTNDTVTIFVSDIIELVPGDFLEVRAGCDENFSVNSGANYTFATFLKVA